MMEGEGGEKAPCATQIWIQPLARAGEIGLRAGEIGLRVELRGPLRPGLMGLGSVCSQG